MAIYHCSRNKHPLRWQWLAIDNHLYEDLHGSGGGGGGGKGRSCLWLPLVEVYSSYNYTLPVSIIWRLAAQLASSIWSSNKRHGQWQEHSRAVAPPPGPHRRGHGASGRAALPLPRRLNYLTTWLVRCLLGLSNTGIVYRDLSNPVRANFFPQKRVILACFPVSVTLSCSD